MFFFPFLTKFPFSDSFRIFSTSYAVYLDEETTHQFNVRLWVLTLMNQIRTFEMSYTSNESVFLWPVLTFSSFHLYICVPCDCLYSSANAEVVTLGTLLLSMSSECHAFLTSKINLKSIISN